MAKREAEGTKAEGRREKQKKTTETQRKATDYVGAQYFVPFFNATDYTDFTELIERGLSRIRRIYTDIF